MWTKAQLLTQHGHTVHVLSSTEQPGPELRTVEEDGVTVHRFRPPHLSVTMTEVAPYWVAHSWVVFMHLRALEQQHTYDLIQFAEYQAEGYVYQLDRSPWAWTPVAVQLYAPLMALAEQTGWPAEGSDLARVGEHMESETIRLADRVLSLSETSADFAASRYGVDRDSIDVVSVGMDLELFKPGPAPDPARPVVAFAGNVSRAKGLPVAFEAVMRLRERYPGIVLRVMGEGSNYLRKRIQRQAAEAGVPGIVDFVGFVADRAALAERLREATVFCLPADFECGPVIANLEAMACGCPVVTADSPGAREGMVEGETGFIVPPGDAEATAAALERVIADTELRAKLGDSARRHVEANFGLEQWVERVLQAYERTIEVSRKRLTALEQLAS